MSEPQRYFSIRFYTNVDAFKTETWPTLFSEAMMPRIGERVMARSGRSLCVVGITHREDRAEAGRITHRVEIELNY